MALQRIPCVAKSMAIERVNKIKIPATQAWKAACELFNEIDGRYAEAEKYLDGGILSYRATERRRAEAEAAAIRKQQEEARAAAFSMAGYDESDYYGFAGAGGSLGPAVPLDDYGYDDYR